MMNEPTRPLPTLGDLDVPTLEIARDRITSISDKVARMLAESTRVAVEVRYPKRVRICRGLRWEDGNFVTSPYVPSSTMQLILQKIALSANTPKLRSRALDNLKRVEEWLDKRIEGITRHANHVRELQGVYEEKLKSEVAMVTLQKERGEIDEDNIPF